MVQDSEDQRRARRGTAGPFVVKPKEVVERPARDVDRLEERVDRCEKRIDRLEASDA